MAVSQAVTVLEHSLSLEVAVRLAIRVKAALVVRVAEQTLTTLDLLAKTEAQAAVVRLAIQALHLLLAAAVTEVAPISLARAQAAAVVLPPVALRGLAAPKWEVTEAMTAALKEGVLEATPLVAAGGPLRLTALEEIRMGKALAALTGGYGPETNHAAIFQIRWRTYEVFLLQEIEQACI